MRTYKIYVDMSSRNIYSENGAELTAETAPYSSYKEKIQLWIQYLNSPTLTDVYTGFASLAVASSATVDNNMNQYDIGALNASKSGAITSIAVKNLEAVPRLKSGEIQLINSTGQNETVAFTNYTVSNGVYTFTVSDTLTYSYSADDEVRVKETPIMKTENADIDSTGKATGLFKITLDGLTQPFEKLVEGSFQIAGCYFEHQIFETSDPDRPICTALMPFRCFGILDNGGVIPPANASEFYTKVQVDALLLAAKEFQFSVDGSTLWHTPQVEADRFYRERYPSGEWSVAIAMVQGPKGEDGSGAVDSVNGYTGTVVLAKSDIGLGNVTNDAQLKAASNLSDLPSAATARTNLGLGDSATKSTGTGSGTVAAGDHNHTGVYEAANANIQSHISSTSNPHSVTASQAGAVAVSGNETVAGIKTFSSSPIVPTPTTDYQAATKKYVDDNAGSGSTSDTTWTSSNFTSTSVSSSQRVLQEALKNVGVDTLATSLVAADDNKLLQADVDTSIKLLMHLDGDIADSSLSAHALTNTSSTSDAANKKFGLASRAFASGQYITSDTSADYTFGSNDFSIEFQLKMPSTTNGMEPLGSWDYTSGNKRSWQFMVSHNAAHKIEFAISTDGTDSTKVYITHATTVDDNAWHHIYAGRHLNTMYLAVDGVVQSTTVSGSVYSANTFRIAANLGSSSVNQFIGNIDELCIRDANIYTADFTPPALAYAVSKYTVSSLKTTDILSNPMTASGDIIYGGVSGAATRLAKGTDGQKLKLASGIPAWSDDIILNQICNGRLTLESGVAVSSSDQTAKTTLYFTPYNGNRIALYDGSANWIIYTFAEISLSLSGLTANTNYDVFIYNNSGTLTLESLAWTNDTTRATALTTQDGVYVKTGAISRRYLGTIRITATTGQCEDSQTKRFVWNLHNQVSKKLKVTSATSSYATTNNAWHPFLNETTFRVEAVAGLFTLLELNFTACLIAESNNGYLGIGIDSTSTNSADIRSGGSGSLIITAHAELSNYHSGYHYYQALEIINTATTCTFYGSPNAGMSSGMLGKILQ